MEAIHSAPRQTLLLSSLLQDVPFSDVQALARLNVIRYERDPQQTNNSSELVVTFRSKLTRQVFDEIRHSYTSKRDRWNIAHSFFIINWNILILRPRYSRRQILAVYGIISIKFLKLFLFMFTCALCTILWKKWFCVWCLPRFHINLITHTLWVFVFKETFVILKYFRTLRGRRNSSCKIMHGKLFNASANTHELFWNWRNFTLSLTYAVR